MLLQNNHELNITKDLTEIENKGILEFVIFPRNCPLITKRRDKEMNRLKGSGQRQEVLLFASWPHKDTRDKILEVWFDFKSLFIGSFAFLATNPNLNITSTQQSILFLTPSWRVPRTDVFWDTVETDNRQNYNHNKLVRRNHKINDRWLRSLHLSK